MLIDDKFKRISGNLELELVQLYKAQGESEEIETRLESIVNDYQRTQVSAEAYYQLGQIYTSEKWDLDTVDDGVTNTLKDELKNPQSWDVFIGHFLGVDHAGHKHGPNHPEMTRKLGEMNRVLEYAVTHLPEDCVLFAMGDHGMTMTGDHGGDSNDEVSAALFIYGKKGVSDNVLRRESEHSYHNNSNQRIIHKLINDV